MIARVGVRGSPLRRCSLMERQPAPTSLRAGATGRAVALLGIGCSPRRHLAASRRIALTHRDLAHTTHRTTGRTRRDRGCSHRRAIGLLTEVRVEPTPPRRTTRSHRPRRSLPRVHRTRPRSLRRRAGSRSAGYRWLGPCGRAPAFGEAACGADRRHEARPHARRPEGVAACAAPLRHGGEPGGGGS